MSRTTSATQLAPNSPMRRSGSCVKKFPRIGRTSAIRSPTISASSTPRIFGLWRERGIPFMTMAQSQTPPVAANQQLLKSEELDALVAPIALYPDALLAEVLMASTYPLEVVQAERWAAE